MTLKAAVGTGNGLYLNSDPSFMTRQVAVKMAELYHNKIVDILVPTGLYTFRATQIPKGSEGQAMKKVLLENGVNPNIIFVEDRAKETVKNACYSKEIILQQGVKEIYLVSPIHQLEKARTIFTIVYGPEFRIIGVESEDSLVGAELKQAKRNEKLSLEITMELMKIYNIHSGDHKSILKMLDKTHIAYTPTPIIPKELMPLIRDLDEKRKLDRKYTINPDKSITI